MSINTANPLEAARALPRNGHWALLYSGMRSQGSGGQSFLAYEATQVIDEGGFAALEQALAQNPQQRWFGYLGYGLRHELETLKADDPAKHNLPDLCLFAPTQIRTWQHASPVMHEPIGYPVPGVVSLSSNMSKAEYLAAVQATIARIHAGEFYQANITRKFTGRFATAPDSFALFEQLCAISPAPFSAYIQMGDVAILSSSPEGFLSVDAAGDCISRPIKGSAARGATPAEDAAILAALAHSEKDKAENLMIVDLMRNDLSRVATHVEVSALHEVHSYATIHQMISTVTAQKKTQCTVVDVVKACFPPGSMTGAPKIRAMDWCSHMERTPRGVYSGAIGWMDGQTCDLSVVIRTLIIRDDQFEFQVGGGIVADSEPEKEWVETLVKARAMAQVLGIDIKALEAI